MVDRSSQAHVPDRAGAGSTEFAPGSEPGDNCFAAILHKMVTDVAAIRPDLVKWTDRGTSFVVFNARELEEKYAGKYFGCKKRRVL